MDIEEPKKLTFGILFALIFPLFGIYLFSAFEFMGISLLHDIFLGFNGNFSSSIYEWFFALFRGDIINQFIQHGAFCLFQEPLAQSILTWFTTGFLMGVIIKNMKRTFLLSLIVPLIQFILLVIFSLINSSIIELFTSNLIVLLGGLIVTFGFIYIGSYLGSLAGK